LDLTKTNRRTPARREKGEGHEGQKLTPLAQGAPPGLSRGSS